MSLRLYWLKESVSYLRYVSEKYAPRSDNADQYCVVTSEIEELSHELWLSDYAPSEDAAKECADVIIAAVRLGTMLSPDFAQVILDKCKELDAREPLL